MDSAYLSQTSSIDQQSNTNMNFNNSTVSSPLPFAPLPPSSSTKPVGRRRASMFDPIDPTELQKTLYNNATNTNNVSKKKSFIFIKFVCTVKKIEQI